MGLVFCSMIALVALCKYFVVATSTSGPETWGSERRKSTRRRNEARPTTSTWETRRIGCPLDKKSQNGLQCRGMISALSVNQAKTFWINSSISSSTRMLLPAMAAGAHDLTMFTQAYAAWACCPRRPAPNTGRDRRSVPRRTRGSGKPPRAIRGPRRKFRRHAGWGP